MMLTMPETAKLTFKFQYDNTLRRVRDYLEEVRPIFKFQYDNTLREEKIQE